MILPNVGANEGNMYGPVLPQAPEADCEDIRDVLDPMHVPGKGAPKKKLSHQLLVNLRLNVPFVRLRVTIGENAPREMRYFNVHHS